MFSPTEIASKYTTYRLQLKLQIHFGESLVVETQQGQGVSNLAYSSSVSMVEAIQTAHQLKIEKDSMKLETFMMKMYGTVIMTNMGYFLLLLRFLER